MLSRRRNSVQSLPVFAKIDADGHCEGDDCGYIQVKAEVTQEPVMAQTRAGKTDSAIVGGQVTYTFTYNPPPNKSTPLSNTSVHEDVKNTYSENGREKAVPTYPRDDKTDTNGQVPDQSAMVSQAPNPSGTGNNKAADYLSQNVIEKDTQ